MGASMVSSRIPLASADALDGEALAWLRRAYDENL
jgi:hypothetical protein